MTDKEAAEQFWTFALSVYGREAAREAFLRLQDRDGADVPMLLWCLWCGATRRGVSASVMQQAVMFSEAWRAAVVGPLRSLRRGLKSGANGVSLDSSEKARQAIASTEQAVERMQMDALAGMPQDEPSSDALALIKLYAQVAGLSFDAADVAVVSDGL